MTDMSRIGESTSILPQDMKKVVQEHPSPQNREFLYGLIAIHCACHPSVVSQIVEDIIESGIIMSLRCDHDDHPQPSREKLDHLFEQHRSLSNPVSFHELPLKSALMAWATGETKKKVWCKHLTWVPPRQMGMRPGYWAYTEQNIAAEWICCPVCRTERPEEG